MPVTRPSLYLDWTDGNASKVTEPGSSKKLEGWIVESPPFQYMNWLFWLTDSWIQWLDQLTIAQAAASGITAATTVLTTTGTTVNGSNQLSSMALTTGVLEGMAVTGTGIPANTRVKLVSGANIFLTKVATASNVATSLVFSHHVATGANVQAQLNQLDAIIGAVSPTVLITTGDTTNLGYSLANLGSVVGLAKGMAISGTGITAGTVISSIAGSTVTMSLPATATNSGIFATFSHNYATALDIEGMIDQLDAQMKAQGGLGQIGRKTITAAYTVRFSDTGTILDVDTSAAAVALTLPDPASFVGVFTVRDVSFTFNTFNCTLVRFAAESIEGLAATYTMEAQGGVWTWRSNGTNWFLVA